MRGKSGWAVCGGGGRKFGGGGGGGSYRGVKVGRGEETISFSDFFPPSLHPI